MHNKTCNVLDDSLNTNNDFSDSIYNSNNNLPLLLN